ncbi:MAG: hypothetical protein IBX64_04255 [Actinobacteria bacterium]|nr:hypothetical protein [Actinomycetota bacterium]
MSIGHELIESLKHIPGLERQLASLFDTLEEQASWLESRIDELVNQNHDSWDDAQRLEVLAKLSLLSELYAVISFDKMIEARERFQNLFPEHFKEYLNHLNSLSHRVSWPGCLECRHFNGKCSLSLTPMEISGGRYGFEKRCKFKERKAKVA